MGYGKWIAGILMTLLFPSIIWGRDYLSTKPMSISTIIEDGMYLKEEQVYWVRESLDQILGTVSMSGDVEKIIYRVTWYNNVLKEGELAGKEKWCIRNIPLMLGINTIEIKANDKNGNTISQTLKVINTYEENRKGAEIDERDRDCDGLKRYAENYLGTNDTIKDTDGDGISDYDEVYRVVTNPLNKDTNHNEVWDGEEDFDGDLISNQIEVELESNPYNTDTDLDGLDDFSEYMYGTDLDNYDTDGDFVCDGNEIYYAFNPHKKDSNGNGVQDGDEWVEITRIVTSREDIGVEFKGEVQAKNLESLQIVEEAKACYEWVEKIPGYVGPIVSVMGGENVKKGEIFLTLKKGIEHNVEQFMLYAYDEHEMLLKPVKSIKKFNYGKYLSGKFQVGEKYLVINQSIYEAFREKIKCRYEEATVTTMKDSDGDGLEDKIEQGMLLENGVFIQTNPYLADSDGDGLKDKEELNRKLDPLKKDSDGDGLEDKEDMQPLKWNVRERDLALFAQLAYTEASISELRESAIDQDYFLDLASIEELKRWEKIHTFKRDQDYPDLRASFAANVYRLDDELVVAYRGTDGMQDWLENFFIYPLPFIPHPQSQDAQVVLQTIMRMYPESKVYVTGHSLGGYLGLYAVGYQQAIKDVNQVEQCANFNGLGMDVTVSRKLKRGLRTLERNNITSSYKIYFDVVSVIGEHYADMLKGRLAKEVHQKYTTPPVKKWRYMQERHDMANFYNYFLR